MLKTTDLEDIHHLEDAHDLKFYIVSAVACRPTMIWSECIRFVKTN